ncbi:MAG: hypothetical protein F4W89_07435 [Acidobacteria bacterium]|nr:hypothetical protein [Acidobacteriota bacterium]
MARARHARENDSLLAGVEKRALLWMAARLPRWITADHLTVLGLVAMAGVGAAFWASRWSDLALIGVVVGLALNWFGDSLDGTVARIRKHERPRYGFYVDHVVDIASMLLLCAGMALSPHMSPVVALVLLAAYLMVSAEAYLATHACGVFRLSLMKIGPTELRILLAAGAVRLLVGGPDVELLGASWRLFDMGGAIGAAGLFGALVFSALRNGLALYRAEPLPR